MLHGVPYHELVIAAILGAIMGFLGFFLTRWIGPTVERAI